MEPFTMQRPWEKASFWKCKYHVFPIRVDGMTIKL